MKINNFLKLKNKLKLVENIQLDNQNNDSFDKNLNADILKSEKNRFEHFLLENEKDGMRREAFTRLVLVGILLGLQIFGLLLLKIMNDDSSYTNGNVIISFVFKLGFIPIGILQFWLAKKDKYKPWMKYVFLFFDVTWLSLFQILPDFVTYKFGTKEFIIVALNAYNNNKLHWLLLFYAWASFYISTNYVRALGIYIIMAWVITYLFLASSPFTITDFTPLAIAGEFPETNVLRPENYVDFTPVSDAILLVIFMTIGSSFAAKYRNKITTNFFQTEEIRNTLSRFFSPNLIEQLAINKDSNIKTNVDAAIAFADIKNFTNFALEKPPEEVLNVLQDFHSIIENEVFKNDGTLEKYIGDAAMAVFGAPVKSPNDADNAIKCAINWIKAIDKWNDLRIAQGKEVIKIGIGVDYGPVTGGIIGKTRNMSYAVVGATVNRASRLEGLTRDIDAQIIISNELYEALKNKNIFEENGFSVSLQKAMLKNIDEQNIWAIKKS